MPPAQAGRSPARSEAQPSEDRKNDPAGGVSYRRGTTNAWSTLSGDPALGLVYVPTGNTSPDYYGGQRDGLDYYSSSVVALRADSGEVAWHFQTVHHDVWDYDVARAAGALRLPRQGRIRARARSQATKMGHLFLLDRRTGVPLFPVEERPVPQGGVPGETLSPTQPFPTKPAPLHPATLTPDEAVRLHALGPRRLPRRDRVAAL